MSDFNEQNHPRIQGKFTDKVNSEPEGELQVPLKEQSTDDLLAQMDDDSSNQIAWILKDRYQIDEWYQHVMYDLVRGKPPELTPAQGVRGSLFSAAPELVELWPYTQPKTPKTLWEGLKF